MTPLLEHGSKQIVALPKQNIGSLDFSLWMSEIAFVKAGHATHRSKIKSR